MSYPGCGHQEITSLQINFLPTNIIHLKFKILCCAPIFNPLFEFVLLSCQKVMCTQNHHPCLTIVPSWAFEPPSGRFNSSQFSFKSSLLTKKPRISLSLVRQDSIYEFVEISYFMSFLESAKLNFIILATLTWLLQLHLGNLKRYKKPS